MREFTRGDPGIIIILSRDVGSLITFSSYLTVPSVVSELILTSKRSEGIDPRDVDLGLLPLLKKSLSVTGSILRVWSFSVGRFITCLLKLLGAVVFVKLL